jgi:hypothetical protein
MTYSIISTDLARFRTVNGQEAIYIGPVSYHPAYAAWEGQIVTLRDELGEVEVEARLIRQAVGEHDQWYGVLVSPFRDIAVGSAPTGQIEVVHPETQAAS